jgi:RNA polymerase sigma-70 factor (ECF subfamily)
MEFADHALMRQWQAGEPAAFETLVRRWEGRVARFLARMTAVDQVDDATQEVFLRVWRAGAGYRPSAAFSTWLFQIAVNVARDLIRRRRDHEPLSGDEPDNGGGPPDAAQTREIGAVVAQALAELPEPLRLAVVLRHYEGLSFEEIGRVCGAPASTVKSRFAAALERLRPRLRSLKPDVSRPAFVKPGVTKPAATKPAATKPELKESEP